MSDIETRLRQTFRDRLDPIGVPGTLPRDLRARARAGRAAGIVMMALATVAVVAAAAVAIPNVLEGDGGRPAIGASESPFPIVPKENGRIAYTVAGTTGLELHSMRPDGSDDRVIPTPQGDPWLHSWSPDGSRLAVTIFPRGPGARSIWVMEADGSDARQVAEAENVSVPAWSPDGAWIVYAASRDGRTEIHVVASNGTQDHIVRAEEAEGTFAIFSAQFSPDGTKILFDRGTDAFFDIYVMDATGGEAHPLTAAGTDYDPSWSPDGTQIAFTRQEIVDDRATSDIFVMDADGSNVRRLTDDGNATSLYPTWAPDGTKIAYNAGEGGPGGLILMNADGSDREVLVESDIFGVSWQPVLASGIPTHDNGDEPPEEPRREIPVDRFGCAERVAGQPELVEEWLTDPVFVAQGRDGKTPWILCGRLGSNVPGERPGEVLCMQFAYANDGFSTGWDCGFAVNQGNPIRTADDLFAPHHAVEWGYFAGAMPSNAATVTFEPLRGPVIEGELYEAPDELGIAAQFFTLFAEPTPAGTLVARNPQGQLICQWGLSGPLEGPGCPDLSPGRGNP